MNCRRCGRIAGEADRFCAHCGEPLATAEVTATPPPDFDPELDVSVPVEDGAMIATTTEPAIAQTDATQAPEAQRTPQSAAFATPSAPFAMPARPAPKYAGFWRRFAGLLVDALLLFFPQAIIRVLLGLPILANDDRWDDTAVLLAEGTGFAMGLLYASLMECSAGQGTLGQQLLGLRVTGVRGGRISFARAMAHQLAKIPSLLLCGLGYLLQLWNARRQTLHDMMAGCLVVRAEEAPAGEFAVPGVARQS